MSKKEKIGYAVFAISLVLLQFAGYAFVPLVALALLLFFNQEAMKRSVTSSMMFVAFLIVSLTIGLCNTMMRPTLPSALARWTQFYFFAVMLMGVGNKHALMNATKVVVMVIFAADFTANILQVVGVSLPWVHLTIRPGELLPRFQGIKGNSLYSGSISFLAICMLLGNQTMGKKAKIAALCAMTINLLLAGSLRYFIAIAAVVTMAAMRLYRHRSALMTTCITFIGATIVMTQHTMSFSESNYFRFKLWMQTLHRIADAPLLGHGFVFQDVHDQLRFTVRALASHDVTESSILLIALCFGVPVLLLFLAAMARCLMHYNRYPHYTAELGLFLGMTLDLFWGGSLDNCMSLTVWLTAMYMINDHASSQTPNAPSS